MSSKLVSRIHLFTRANCSLCVTARSVLANVQGRRSFELRVVDVMEARNVAWKVYEFDVPVIHVEPALDVIRDTGAVSSSSVASPSPPAPLKLMHRFTEAQVEELLDKVEMSLR